MHKNKTDNGYLYIKAYSPYVEGIVGQDIKLSLWQKLSNHIKRWNAWRKHNTNCRFHKFLTLLFGSSVSPTFASTLTEEEAKELDDAIMKALNK